MISAAGIVCALNILAIIACGFVIYAEYSYLDQMSKVMMIVLISVNVVSLLINMGVIN
ncbi:hypothetical protein BPS13_0030 [Bacillus phage BPS13]|uniref:Uncharacterized protein n=2 Tax=Wphvirus BPS13 TaxID=1987727 RepID=A0A173GBK9_9CAUD|nr:hypothetical protein BPS13_0030 [Bacillus phage BPS13]YP_009281998.1 hypothetical protein SALINJAH_44 [Bacillus phage SalinJah]AEZ50209.1 hypothetical protein BPS13_0030 [Bacillus phage BPS13]ANH50687.1 hypothetical protein SALINJAH_44 [Bacillus phage SalinJah]